MILEIRKDGLTRVNITSAQDIAFVVAGIVGILRQIDIVDEAVSDIMANSKSLESLGMTTEVIHCTSNEDQEKKLQMIKDRKMAAQEEDIPTFVKRSLEDE